MFKPPFATKEDAIYAIRSHIDYSYLIKKAFKQAHQSHHNQLRDNGENYLTEHIYPVVVSVCAHNSKNDNLENLVITALLHDVVEDDNLVELKDIEDSFGPTIAEFINLLTKRKIDNNAKLPQDEHIKINKSVVDNLMDANIIPRIIKVEDRLNNISCIPVPNNPKFQRYLFETELNFIPLASTIDSIYVDLLTKQIKRLQNRL